MKRPDSREVQLTRVWQGEERRACFGGDWRPGWSIEGYAIVEELGVIAAARLALCAAGGRRATSGYGGLPQAMQFTVIIDR